MISLTTHVLTRAPAMLLSHYGGGMKPSQTIAPLRTPCCGHRHIPHTNTHPTLVFRLCCGDSWCPPSAQRPLLMPCLLWFTAQFRCIRNAAATCALRPTLSPPLYLLSQWWRSSFSFRYQPACAAPTHTPTLPVLAHPPLPHAACLPLPHPFPRTCLPFGPTTLPHTVYPHLLLGCSSPTTYRSPLRATFYDLDVSTAAFLRDAATWPTARGLATRLHISHACQDRITQPPAPTNATTVLPRHTPPIHIVV